MSRPSALTDDVYRGILAAIRAGNDNVVAAGAQGINESTLYRWLERGTEDAPCVKRGLPSAADPLGKLEWSGCESGDHAAGECPGNDLYRELRQGADQARREFEVLMSGYVAKAAPTNPRLALEVLARRVPERWKAGRNTEPAATTGGAPFSIVLIEENRSPADIREIEQLLRNTPSASDLPAKAASGPPDLDDEEDDSSED